MSLIPAAPRRRRATRAVAVAACASLCTVSALLAGAACAARGAAQQIPAAALQPPKPVPSGGASVVDGADQLAGLRISNRAELGAAETVDVRGVPFARALRLTTKQKGDTEYAIQVSAPTTGAVKQGDVLLATFYVRAVQVQAENGEARTQFVFETGAPDYTKSVSHEVSIPKEWRRIDIPFKAARDSEAGKAQIALRMGYNPQSFEVGGITVQNFGTRVAMGDLPRTPSTYQGQEPNAAWRKAAEARIEKIRKGDLTVRVVDAAGKPVRDAAVAVRMKKHAFPFGSAVAADGILAQTPDGEKYREFIKKHFNRVVMENDLKWPQYEQDPERAKKGVAWLREQGIEVRGHVLVWPGWSRLPKDVQGLKGDKAALAKRIEDHIRAEVTEYRGQLVDWDVVNEPFANHDLMDILGRDAMVRWFSLARANDPKARLFLNDYPRLDGAAVGNDHLEDFYSNIEFLQKSGAPLQGIGFQGHFGGGVTPPERVLSGLDRFAKFGLPIAITEFDINTTDEKLQADYTRDFMTAVFSHPSADAIIMWGFWEGRHWLPDAALLRRDWSVKPNGQAWIDQVFKTWWTNADGKTDGKGEMKARGFYGDYEVAVAAPGGKTKTVPLKLVKGQTAPVVVKLD